MKQIEEDPTVKRMLKRRTLASETRRNYIKGIRFFCQYYGKKPKEIIEKFQDLTLDDAHTREEFFDFMGSIADCSSDFLKKRFTDTLVSLAFARD